MASASNSLTERLSHLTEPIYYHPDFLNIGRDSDIDVMAFGGQVKDQPHGPGTSADCPLITAAQECT
jgi:hypothetical protein